MLVTELSTSQEQKVGLPYVELSFGVIGQTLPADHGYGLYSAIALPPLCGNLIPSLIPQGVEHYTRIGTLFQSLNLRCRKALFSIPLFSQLLSISGFLCRRGADIIAFKHCRKKKKVLEIKKPWSRFSAPRLTLYFLKAMLAPKRDFLMDYAQRLVRERGIAQPPEFWKLSDSEIERFLDIYLWDFVRRASLKYLD